MKKIIIKTLSFLLSFAIILGFIPLLPKGVKAVSVNQQNIADRADFFFNTTWICQKDVNAWRDEFTFKKGETYHLPYGQPVNSGAFIGYGVELEEFLMSAADASSVFYSRQSEFNGWTSVYYATDCAAFVAMCWGTVRQDCSTLPYYSTYMGRPTESNVYNILQLGDALDSTTVGHVVLVSDLIYDDNGTLVQIEITEQTPPQLKRTYFTPAELAAKYGEEFGIYRYEGSVPAVPEWGYTTDCTNYASYGIVEITAEATIMSLPCESNINAEAIQIGSTQAGETYTVTKLYKNTVGELWYRIRLDDDKVGYILADHTIHKELLLDDIVLTDTAYPNAHIKGKTFNIVGNIYAKYSQLVTASYYIYQGFGISSTPKTGATDYVTGNSYTLKNSKIDYSTSFGALVSGNHTITIGVHYRNYHAEDGNVVENSGTLELAQEYFMVVNSTTSQNNCNHDYSQTVLASPTCTQPGVTVFACASCGKVYKQNDDTIGHTFGDWNIRAATCTQNGSETRTCSHCGEIEEHVLIALGHQYDETIISGSCEECPRIIYTCSVCGESYTVYPEEIMTSWSEAFPEGIDPTLIETKTQYRYCDLEVTHSPDKVMDGSIFMGELWEVSQSEALSYVKKWPTGFDKSHALYEQYNQAPLLAFEDEDTKVTIDSDTTTGFLYYHWCYNNSYFSQSTMSSQYTVFHAYYSTSNPDNYRVDPSDMSYCTAHESCSNTDWFFVAEVNTQSITHYKKMYLLGQWQQYGPWSDNPVEASDTRLVETRTLYRYPDLNSVSHDYHATETLPTCTNPGILLYTCNVCGDSYSVDKAPSLGHKYLRTVTEATCTQDGSITDICERCGDTQTTITPASGHQYEAYVTAPTCIEDGYTTYTCACGDNYIADATVATGHSYENGICTACGDVTSNQLVTPTLTLKSPTLEFKDMICIIAFYTAENTQDVVEMGMITYKNKVDTWNVESADYVIPGATYDTNSGRYYSSSQGIHAKYLADTVYLACYARLSDGSYVYTKLAPYSAVTYANSQLKNSNNTALKQLVVAMLNYGTEAQVYFGHNTEALANSNLTAEQAVLPEIYREDMVNTVAPAPIQKQGLFINNNGFSARKPAISFEGAFCINYFFTPKYAPIDGITLYYWNEADYHNSDVLSVENASGYIDLEGTGIDQYRGDIVGISAKNLSQAVYVAAVYSDGTVTWTSGVLGYSIGSYCASQVSKGDDIADLAMATAIYGYHAKQYFG